MINLVASDILLAPTFQSLPTFDQVEFKGFPAEKVQYFSAQFEDQEYSLLAINVIRKEDQFVWDSCRDLLERSLQQAEQIMRGIYRFELLCFDVHRELDSFNPQELMQLVTNHARRLAVGSDSLIKYSSLYGILKKLVEEDWGKLTLHTAMELYTKTPAQFDLLIKRLQKIAESCPGKKFVVINDMSLEPLLDSQDKEQQQRLKKLLAGSSDLFTAGPQVIVHHKTGTRDLTGELGG